MSLVYYVLDTETTGLKAKHHEITEISAIRCSDRNQLTRQVRVEHPDRASYQALQITGKTVQDIIKGEDKEHVVKLFNKFFEEDGLTPEHRCIVGHNVAFDKRFCHALWEDVGFKFPAVCWLDTMKIGKEWVLKTGKAPENYKLASMLKFADIKPMKGVHDAGSDTRNTYLFWKKSIDKGIGHLKLIKREEHKIDTGE